MRRRAGGLDAGKLGGAKCVILLFLAGNLLLGPPSGPSAG